MNLNRIQPGKARQIAYYNRVKARAKRPKQQPRRVVCVRDGNHAGRGLVTTKAAEAVEEKSNA
jgi:hypothetical protein